MIAKQSPDFDLAEVFDDIEDDRRINKHANHFIPYEECGASNEFNPEFMFIAKEEKELNDKDEQPFIIKSPLQQLNHPPHYRPITLNTEESLLELIPCNCPIKLNEPQRLGIGKIRQLKKQHLAR